LIVQTGYVGIKKIEREKRCRKEALIKKSIIIFNKKYNKNVNHQITFFSKLLLRVSDAE